MDELELLKKDWQRNNVVYPKLSKNDIYKMSHSKSSSLVKWIFYIGLIEFAFWFLLAILLKGVKFKKEVLDFEASTSFIVLDLIWYLIPIYFLYRFYTNYKRISATDSARRLMKNILRTRQTVKMYVIFNLVYLVIASIYAVFYVFSHDAETKNLLSQAAADGQTFKVYIGIVLSTILILAVTIGLLLLFYWLIYGLLLKRLNKNYSELKKLEV